MDETTTREFTEFVTERSHKLLRAAYALCADQHAAEDLLQGALAKAAVKWRTIHGQPEPYVRRILYRDFINAWRWRRRRPPEVTGVRVERPGGRDLAEDTAERLRMRDALATLPPRQRAVLVLRFLEDLSLEQVAEVLGCSPGTVASQTSRALAKLRDHLREQGVPPPAGSALIPQEVTT